MATQLSRSRYALAPQHTPGWQYALAFLVCWALIGVAYAFFIGHGWFLLQLPQLDFKTPLQTLARLT